ncbi:hypothetical protein LOD99_13507 [Oopsacas minuta]|uniref:Uncharacterized protein n=1 Tax=Oopsacas minuta TaxID=111878 RepID=A0AAV7KK81_9METZ|nr:hypothetical protein LOD99_13507 [Oopsacas minuta]
MSNIANYYALQNSVPITLPEGATFGQWNEALNVLQNEAWSYQTAANNTKIMLDNFHANLSTDVDAFSTTVTDLNNAVLGDNGILESINGDLADLQGQIGGLITGVTMSTLAIIGGVFVICVGAIADFVTEGASTEMVIGGVGVVVEGIGAEIGTSIELAKLNQAKAELLTEKAELKVEVKIATGIQSGYAALLNQVKSASEASLIMERAWASLSTDLHSMFDYLNSGIMSTGQIREIFLRDADGCVQVVIEDINVIQLQMAGIATNVAEGDETVSDVIMETANGGRLEDPPAPPPPSDTENVAKDMDRANRGQCSQALVIQNYCNSVNEQPSVDFSGIKGLAMYQEDINSGVKTAQTHANLYLNYVQPAIIKNVTNISNYYALHNAVPEVLPKGSTEIQWINVLTALGMQAKEYQRAADYVVQQIQSLHENLTTDSAAFATVVTELNAAVEGDKGVLDSINGQLDQIQKQLDGEIAGSVLSGLAIVAGVFVAAVGLVADFVTAGTSNVVVAGGVAIVLVGVGGEVGTAVVIKELNDEKATLLAQESNLTAEVKVASGISGGYQSLSNQVANAVQAATSMQNAWESLSADLDALISDLSKGIKSADEVRTMFLVAADSTIDKVIKDTDTIKLQMAGVGNVVAEDGQTVGDAIVEATKSYSEVEAKKSLAVKRRTPKVVGRRRVIVKKYRVNRGVKIPEWGVEPVPVGNLAQAIASLNKAEQQIQGISNLPGEAVGFQIESLDNINELIAHIQTLQEVIRSFVMSALPQMEDILMKLEHNDSLNEISDMVNRLDEEANELNSQVTQELTTIQGIITTTNGYFNELASIQNDMNAQLITLQSNLVYAQNQENKASKKYYYLLALGPFGLAGLAAALAAYEAIKKQVSGYEGQISSLNTQIASLNSMIAATGQLTTDFQLLINCLSGVKNSVSFIADDILQIQTDLNEGDARSVIEIAINAGITEVKALSIDTLGTVVSP